MEAKAVVERRLLRRRLSLCLSGRVGVGGVGGVGGIDSVGTINSNAGRFLLPAPGSLHHRVAERAFNLGGRQL